jgi:hypothetical protein
VTFIYINVKPHATTTRWIQALLYQSLTLILDIINFVLLKAVNGKAFEINGEGAVGIAVNNISKITF